MPYNPSTRKFARLYKFVDQFAQSDHINRSDLDVALDDLVGGLNAALSNGLNYIGEWDATTPFPAELPDGKPVRARDVWRVSVAGTRDGITFDVGDYLVALINRPTDFYEENWMRMPQSISAEMLRVLSEALNASDDAEDYAQQARQERLLSETARNMSEAHRDDAERSAGVATTGPGLPDTATFISDVAAGRFGDLEDGQVVTAGGLRYMRKDGATVLPGLPGWVPAPTATLSAWLGDIQAMFRDGGGVVDQDIAFPGRLETSDRMRVIFEPGQVIRLPTSAPPSAPRLRTFSAGGHPTMIESSTISKSRAALSAATAIPIPWCTAWYPPPPPP